MANGLTAPADLVVDGHLDLATSVYLLGRDMTVPARQTRAAETRERAQATVSLPDLVAGHVGIVFATLWTMPRSINLGNASMEGLGPLGMKPYQSPQEAEAQALQQLDLYRRWEDERRVRLILSKAGLADHLAAWQIDHLPGLVILMEGADPIVTPDDLPAWWDRGLRLVGPAWGATRYAGGTGAPGGLSPQGRDLVAGLRETGMVLDMSHLAEQSFWDAIEIGPGRLMASHSSARHLVPGDRQLSDDMIRAIGARDGVVGLPLYNLFLDAAWSFRERPPVTLGGQFLRHAEHVAGLIGWERVAIGSDLDGGFGLLESPDEIDTVADLRAVGAALPAAGQGLAGGNWLRFLGEVLPD